MSEHFCDPCARDECQWRGHLVVSCPRFVPKPESNYDRLFGTPERAARTLSIMQRCELGLIGSCLVCEMHDACMVRDGDYDALLEWLKGASDEV